MLFRSVLHDVRSTFYADDSKIMIELTGLEAVNKLNQRANDAKQWATENSMTFSAGKSAFIQYGQTDLQYEVLLGDELITREPAVTDLGVVYDEKLTFREHIKKVKKKAAITIHMFKDTFRSRDTDLMKTYYRMHLKPVVGYASQVWMRYDKVTIDALDSIDRRFWKCSPTQRGQIPPGIRSLSQEMLMNDLRLAKDIYDQRVAVDWNAIFRRVQHPRSTRANTRNDLLIPGYSRNPARHVYSRRTPRLLNLMGTEKLDLPRAAFIKEAEIFAQQIDFTQLIAMC